MCKLISVAAYSKPTRAIGLKGKLPWAGKLPEEHKYFNDIVNNGIGLMGRVTWEAVLDSDSRGIYTTPLSFSIIVSKTLKKGIKLDSNRDNIVVNSLQEAIDYIKMNKMKEVFVLGGSKIYEEAMDRGIVSEMWLSEIPDEYQGDAFFPPINEKLYKINETIDYNGFQVLKYTKI